MSVRSKIFLSTLSVALVATGMGADEASAQKRRNKQKDAPVQVQAVQVQAEQVASEPAAEAQQPAQAAQSQTPARPLELAAGAPVRDTNGGEVGMITSVDGQFVVVKTDRHEVRLPVTSFAPNQDHFLFAMTRDQLNAEVDKTKAQASAALTAGATVTGSQGGTVGTIDAIDAEFITLKLTSGKLVRLPRNAVAANATGGIIGMTAAELEAAAAAAGGGS